MRRSKYTEKIPVTLTKWQRNELKKAAKERKVSRAHLVRVALGKYLSEGRAAA